MVNEESYGIVFSIIDSYLADADECIKQNDDDKCFELINIILAGLNQFGFKYDTYNVVMSSKPNKHVIELTRLKNAMQAFRVQYHTDQVNVRNHRSTSTTKNHHQTNVSVIQSQAQSQHQVLTFESAINWVKDSPYIGDEKADEILKKINEIKAVSDSNSTKKEKWFKLRDLLDWLTKEGVEIAIKLMPLILQTINGQL